MWNFRDAGSPLTVSQLEEVVRLHSPELVFLAETKNKKFFMNKIRMRLRYDSLFVVDPIGRAGGLAVLWRRDLVVKRVLFTDFTIELNVEGKGTEEDWWFVGIYASSNDQLREQQWKTIEHRANIWGRNWILAGDMNDLLSSGEKWGGKQRSDRSFRIFRNFVNNNQLIDIEFEGIPWTWCNNWDEEGEVRERFDRILCSRD